MRISPGKRMNERLQQHVLQYKAEPYGGKWRSSAHNGGQAKLGDLA